MINIADNFNLAGSTKPLDGRDEFATVAEMKACTVCNEKHICYVRENEKQYQFSSSNTLDSTTGYWREYTVGSGNGDVVGATIGGTAVEKVAGVLQLPAYPTVPAVPVKGIKEHGASQVINPDGNGIVELPAPPSVPITGVKQGNTTLTPVGGIVTVTDFQPSINIINNKLQQIANQEPISVPVSAVNLPTTGNFTYDPDTTYVMFISEVQSPTIHYPYRTGTTDYAVFKAIDSDLYYVYTVSGTTYTYSNSYTWSTLPADARAKFESGIYAVKQVINNDGTIPEGSWKHGVPSVFVTRHNYPIRYRQIYESPNYYILIKNDEVNRIYKYSVDANNKWSLVTGGCYTKGDSLTGSLYTQYDKYFDTANAVNVEYGSSNVKAALDELYGNYTVVTSNLPTMGVSDSIPTPTKNTYYDYGATALSIVNVSGIPITNTCEVVIRFLTHSSNECTLVLDDTSGYQQRIIGSTALAKGKVYVMSILRGVVCICEAPVYEAPVVEEPEETT